MQCNAYKIDYSNEKLMFGYVLMQMHNCKLRYT